MAPVIIAVYVALAVPAAWWSFHNGTHRADASATARVIGAIVAGLVWPAIAVDVWLLDPDDTRRGRKRR